MTLPYERTNAVLRTRDFLLNLCDPKVTPRIPKSIRGQARSLLKHYPSRFDISEISSREEQTISTYKVFGIDDRQYETKV
jgi:hypothetical protein